MIVFKFLLFFLGTFCFTLFMVFVLLGFAKSLGIRSKNDIHVRWSNLSKPSLGGIAIFVSIFLAVVVYEITHPNENVFGNRTFLSFFAGICCAFLMGLADDAFNTRPLIKLFTQILCGISLVIGNAIIPISNSFWVDAFLTIFWTVGLMNSLNMLDNMDGITSGVSISIFTLILAFSFIFSGATINIHTFILIALIGSLGGFLLHNAPPSKLFMGDSGSQIIGYSVAFYTAYFILVPQRNDYPMWLIIYVALMILALPFIDTFTVTFNRIKKGQSPAKGGKDHTTHYLIYRGFSERKTFLFYWITSFILGCAGLVMLWLYNLGFSYFSLLPLILFFITFYFLFKNTHVSHPNV